MASISSVSKQQNPILSRIDSEILGKFGEFGLSTIHKINAILKTFNQALSYNLASQKFTISNSENISKEIIENRLVINKWFIWKPEVLDKLDEGENWVFRLVQGKQPNGFSEFLPDLGCPVSDPSNQLTETVPEEGKESDLKKRKTTKD